ncbi:hypothetical protein FI667_g8631, partial [Globisporangium splendens]
MNILKISAVYLFAVADMAQATPCKVNQVLEYNKARHSARSTLQQAQLVQDGREPLKAYFGMFFGREL